MNAEIRELHGDAERAARIGDVPAAVSGFVEAGDAAARFQLWRTALRCYRNALEIDLLDRVAIARIVRLAGRLGPGTEWIEYARVIDRVDWTHFGARGARILLGDAGGVIECRGAGAVLEVMMSQDDLVELHPDARFAAMPLAMALVVTRCALWPVAREGTKPDGVRVLFAGRSPMWLDPFGDWRAL